MMVMAENIIWVAQLIVPNNWQ